MTITRIGVLGCGNISGIYLKNLTGAKSVEVTAVADLLPARAAKAAAEFRVPRALSPEELLNSPSVDIVLNLTIPRAHAEVALAAVRAGKHIYNEKPLCVKRSEAEQLMAEAARRGMLVGCAPDTFLGAGLQTCRGLIDAGAIGTPVAATANMVCRGHESWHPDPAFYYQHGGGPMLDMGPYYVTALVSMLGPVRRVTGSTRKTWAERTIASEPKRGEKIAVEVPTHVTGVLDFAQGAIGTITTTFDVHAANLPLLEIYGSEGSLSLPDPNAFGGPVRLRKGGESAWRDMPLTHGHAENSRGMGVVDLAHAVAAGKERVEAVRASGKLALHVLDIMESIHEASDAGRHLTLRTTVERPAALAPDWNW